MKDDWKLFEEAMMGCKDSYVKLMQPIIPIILKYYLTIYQGQQPLAAEATGFTLEKAQLKLRRWSREKLFLDWLLTELALIKPTELSAEFKNEIFLKEFTEIYANEISNYRFSFDSLTIQKFSSEEILTFQQLIDVVLNSGKINLETNILNIEIKLSNLKDDWKFTFANHQFLLIFSSTLLVAIPLFFIFFDKNYSPKKEIDFTKLQTIHAPMNVIFESFYSSRLMPSDMGDEEIFNEEMDLSPNKTVENSVDKPIPSVVIETKTPETEINSETSQKSIGSPDKKLATEVITNENKELPIKKEEKKEEKPVTIVDVEKPEIAPTTTKTETSEIKPSIESKPKEEKMEDIPENETEIEAEMVVINSKDIPVIPKADLNKTDGSIRIGGDEKKYNLKEFADQKVIFYSFLEVKDVEKAKVEAFAILKKFGYKGEVLKKQNEFLILTATFPGKENHDRMIRKFNGLGTLYVGNDVAEFLELYKKDLDKERSKFFPKYKPEDLPKEVTVNLYVFPKQKKDK